jgi:hypothetical protein
LAVLALPVEAVVPDLVVVVVVLSLVPGVLAPRVLAARVLATRVLVPVFGCAIAPDARHALHAQPQIDRLPSLRRKKRTSAEYRGFRDRFISFCR